MLDVNSLDLTPGRAEKAVVRFLLICRQTGLQSVSEKNPIKIFCLGASKQIVKRLRGKYLGRLPFWRLLMAAFVIDSGSITSRRGTMSLTDVQLWNWKVFNAYRPIGVGERRNGFPSSDRIEFLPTAISIHHLQVVFIVCNRSTRYCPVTIDSVTSDLRADSMDSETREPKPVHFSVMKRWMSRK